jgi:prepilin-type processing-associated H-X9-DG protein
LTPPAVQEQTQALSNMKQIALAMIMFAQDHDGLLPQPGMDIEQVLSPYIKNNSLFTRPGRPNEHPFQYLPSRALSAEPTNVSPAEIPFGIFTTDYRGGFIVGFLDGHVRWCKKSDLPALMQKLQEAEGP